MRKFYFFILSAMLLMTNSFAQTIIPASDELILPQYAAYGNTGERLTVVCRLTLTGLSVSTNYRYASGLSSSDNLTTSFTPGHFMTIRNTATTYGNIDGYSTLKGLNGAQLNNDQLRNSGSTNYYGTFTTDASGNYTGWFAATATGGTGQISGSNAYFYVQLGSNSSPAYLPSSSYRTTNTIKLLPFGTTSADITGIMGATSGVGDEKFVSLYDNASATGRPLFTTFTESDGVLSTPLASWYTNSVNGVSGAWGAIIPNNLSTGVRAITYTNVDGTSAGASRTSADGNFGIVSTVNPSGGTSPINLDPTVLGVNLSDFNAKPNAYGVNLKWQTLQETNSKYFEVLRAGNDLVFTSIGTRAAAGNSSQKIDYNLFDANPLAGTNYYKLMQYDLDGKANSYGIIHAAFGLTDETIKVMQFNATSLEVNVSSAISSKGSLSYISLDGRILYQSKVEIKAGLNTFSIPTQASFGNIGIISYQSGNEYKTLKVSR